ncbi:MAG: methylhydantoinase [Candidatus Dormiibacter spiritus]|nr:MAG: methylhydantoinase [Candidatus Dormibacteraeota bacterium]
MKRGERFRVGIDVGGTFTDLAALGNDGQEVMVEKVLTTPGHPWLGIRAGLGRMAARGLDMEQASGVIHGTTLVTNAVIERRGARVGLICTKGFRDVLYFGREFRYDVYDPDLVLPDPLVPRASRREVDERIAADGTVVRPLDTTQARVVIRSLLAEDVESIAICLLHSYHHPQHEIVLKSLVREEHRSIPISVSHEVLPQVREYERASGTALNAYVQPIVHEYLQQLEDGLRALGCRCPLYLMTSSGGTITVDTAVAFPIQLMESGPAAGALVAALIGRQAGHASVVSFDMGGTTAKSCVIQSHRPLINKAPEVARQHRMKKGSGIPVGVPMVDLLEIGAGGGSIAELDPVGLLRVGPRSAGAEPGPACYRLGGQEPTVTDANMVLGLISPDSFLGGSMQLDPEAACLVLTEKIAQPMGLKPVEAGAAIHRVVTDNMAEATRVHAAELNVDLRSYSLVAYGGAGPLHAYGVAERLGLSTVVFPRNAGVLSATGLLAAPLAFEFVRSYPAELDAIDLATVNALLGDLESKARGLLQRSGVSEDITLERTVDMCYSGQRYEVATPLPEPPLTHDSIRALKLIFDVTYESAYGRRLAQLPASCLTWRVRGSGPAADRWWRTPHESAARTGGGSAAEQSPQRTRQVFLPGHGPIECRVIAREALTVASDVRGPSLVEDGSSTIVIPPRAAGVVDPWGNLVVELAASC